MRDPSTPRRRPGPSAASRRAGVALRLVLMLVAAGGSTATAQTTTQTRTPGGGATVEQRVDDLRPGAPAAPSPRPEVGPSVPAEPAPSPAPSSVPAFVLAGVVLDGARALPLEALAPLYEPYLARSVGPDDLAALAGAVTTRYREAGLILSRAEIPPQSVTSGVLRVRVIEGYVAEVRVDGLSGAQAERARARLRQAASARPARLADIDRAISLVEALAGVAVTDSRVESVEGADDGAHRLIAVAESEPLDAVVYADNRGDREVGAMLAWFGVGANDALGAGERIEGGVYTVPDDPTELLYGEARLIAPVGETGTRIDLALSGSSSESGGDQDDADLISRSRTLAVGVEHPVILGRRETLTLRGEAASGG